jgi:hypothetical protein
MLLMNNRLGDPSEVRVLRWLGDKSLACSQALPPGRESGGSIDSEPSNRAKVVHFKIT